MRSRTPASTPAALPAVERIETTEVCVPRLQRNRISTSYATLPDAHHALVRVHAGGLVGIGEAPAELWWTGEDAASVRNAIERYLAPAVVGATGIREAATRMDAALAANPYAKAAVEMALWDLLGQVAGLPLRVLIGGGDERRVPVKYVIGMVEPDHARGEVEHGRSLGFTTFKVKVGGELARDLARVGAVADALAAGERVGVDANGGWSRTTAIAALQPLTALGASFLEQPVSARHPAAMADVTARSAIPVVAHESVFTVGDGLQAVTGAIAHAWALTPPTHGGLLATLDLLALARAAGVGCLLGSTVELGVATAFMAQIGAAVSELRDPALPSDVIGPLYHEVDLLAEPIEIAGGFAHAPDGAGLGARLDDDAVARWGGSKWR